MTNAPDGLTHPVPAAGTYEFDIDIAIGAAPIDARAPRRFSYFGEAPNFTCEATQWLTPVPTTEMTWDAETPPAGSPYTPAAWGGWDCNVLQTCTVKLFGGTVGGGTFTSRLVAEFGEEPGMPAVIDTCYAADPSQNFDPAGLTPVAPWTIEGDGYYRFDGVGWLNDAVNYYRALGVAPCEATIAQRMAMMIPWWPTNTYFPRDPGYRDQVLKIGIDLDCAGTTVPGAVYGKRDGVCDSK